MKFGIKIKPEDCSLLGREILKYMEQHQLSMNKMAHQVGITQPGLRVITLKGGNPTESNITKLARVMGRHPTELYQLVYEDKIREMAEPDAIARLTALLMEMFGSLRRWIPEQERPSDYELLDKAFKAIKSLQE